MPEDKGGFVSGKMVGVGKQPARQSPTSHIEYRPRTGDGQRAITPDQRTVSPDWIRQPKNPEAIIIARDSFERPIELNTAEYMDKMGMLNLRKFHVGECCALKRSFSLYPFTLKWEEGTKEPVVGELKEQLIEEAILGNRYEAKWNDRKFINEVCLALIDNAPDYTQGGKYYSRSRFPQIPAGTKLVVTDHQDKPGMFTTCGGFNVYIVEVAEGPAKGFRFVAYSSDVDEVKPESD